jgi:hypothetical protein
MFERSELALKILCGTMLALVLYRLVLVLVHINPLYHVVIPALPSLTSDAAAGATKPGANSSTASAKTGTNVSSQVANRGSTNAAVTATNLVAHSTNRVEQATNSLAKGTNAISRGSNVVAQATNATMHATNSVAQATNAIAQPKSKPGSTGPQPADLAHMGMPPGGMPGMPPGMQGMPGMPKPGPALPPEIQARLDRIVDSEILAPVMHPLPMALLGILGNDIFLRAPSGQTGLIKEGEELGGVKLLRIGINRVLVEEKGERKELTIFDGLGSESLLATKKDSPK